MLSTRYHKDVGIPANIVMPRPGLPLDYSTHAWQRTDEKRISKSLLPPVLPSIFEVIEVDVVAGRPLHWVVRFYATSTQDIVMVVRVDGLVKTVWLNHRADQHVTLRQERYARV